METIYYTSDLKWFGKITTDKYASKREMVAHHLSYTTEKAEYILGNKEEFLRKVELADKRVNSRVAFSFVFALPNDLDSDKVKQWTKDIREKIANLFGMNEEDILIAYHDDIGVSGEPNKHIHIAGLNLASDGKSLRINQKELRQLHKELQGYIKSQGYKIRKDNENERHIGTRLRHDKKAREEYQEYVKTKKEKREKENELLRRVRKAVIGRNFEREKSVRQAEESVSNLIGRNRIIKEEEKEYFERIERIRRGKEGENKLNNEIDELAKRVRERNRELEKEIDEIEEFARRTRERDREYRERIRRIRKQLEELERLKKQEQERKNKTVYIDIFGTGEKKTEPKKEQEQKPKKPNRNPDGSITLDLWGNSKDRNRGFDR